MGVRIGLIQLDTTMLKRFIGLSLSIFLYACGGGGNSSAPTAVSPPVVVVQTPAVISGIDTGEVTDNVTFIANGLLSITDAQSGEAAFQVQTDEVVDFGLFGIAEQGEWNFTLTQSDAVSELTENQQLVVEVAVLSVDGTSHIITITINGAPLNNESDLDVKSEVTLDSDGKDTGLSAYVLIENAFADGSIETPDLYSTNHTEVEHIVEDEDLTVGPHFVFLAHRDLDHDRDAGPNDRQRNEIKSYDKSDVTLKAYLNDTFQYSWKFRVTSDMQLSSRFSHFFQIKAKNFSEDNSNGNDNQPMFTLSGAEKSSSGNELQVRYNSGYQANGNSTSDVYLSTVEWALITDEWVEVFVQITYAEEGKFQLNLTRLSDDTTIIDIDEQNIDTWRGVDDEDFVRPKWGIYRSIVETDSLREEEERVQFANFSIKKGLLKE
jgi:VCBS repeat-containing protein